jgi:hypothetical protein
MSNQSIAKRLLYICDKYDKGNLTLDSLQSNILAHGSAMEGLGKEWEELLNSLDGESEDILYLKDPSEHFILGLNVSKRLRENLEQKFKNL